MENNNKPGEKINLELMYIYNWLDTLTLSHPKKNISRDFSDGQLLAEVIKHYLPKMVDLNNYLPASTTNQKCYNWNTLQTRVLKKLNVKLSKKEINDIIMCKSLAIEHLLEKVYVGIEKTIGKSLGFKKDDDYVPENSIEELKKNLKNKKIDLKSLKEVVEDLEKKLEILKSEKEDFENQIAKLTGVNNNKNSNNENNIDNNNNNIDTNNNDENKEENGNVNKDDNENKEENGSENKNDNDNKEENINGSNNNDNENNNDEENKDEENKDEEENKDDKNEEEKNEEEKSEEEKNSEEEKENNEE